MIGETLAGRYTIVRELGAGGMGTVYEAVQLDLERTVAIKVLPLEAAGDVKANARLRQEAMAAARLGHPNVVQVFELGTADDGSPFIVMERLVGASLKGLLAVEHRLSLERAVHIAVQMLDALGAAHAAGIVHRDVKPGNVMVLDEDRVKLVDFGIARFTEDERSVRTTTGTLLGTPAYLAPEQLDARGIDGRTDLHAVGLCLFEMLLGARPWRGSVADVAAAVMRTVPPRVDSRRDDVPAALADAIERALAKDPNARFASATDMSAALRASLPAKISAGSPSPVKAPVPVPVPVPTAPRRSAWPIAVGIAGVLALAGASAGVLFSRRPLRAEAPPAQLASAAQSASSPPVIESASPSAPEQVASEVPAKKPPPAGHLEDVVCNDPRYKYGYLCVSPHPDCYCNQGDKYRHASACNIPFVDGHCTSAELIKAPSTSQPGSSCTIHLIENGNTFEGTGTVSCEYCNMSVWHNEPKRKGVVGAPCTGINHKGETVTGKYLRWVR